MEIVPKILWHLILWLDGRSQKSLRQAVPDLDQLLANPAHYFGYQEIIIRPWHRWASGFALGPLLWLGLVPISALLRRVMLLALVAVNPAGPAQNFPVVAVNAIVLMVLLPACLVLGMYWLRGGSCILDSTGVRLIYGGVEVFCPWSLFSAPGQPVIHPPHSRNRFELPVAAAAAPRVEARRGGVVIGHGLAIKTGQLRFRSAHEIILRNLYRVKPDELSWLLLHLGRSQALSSFTLKELPAQTPYQGNFQTQQSAENLAVKGLVSSPPATRRIDGWITVSLTRLGFPPWCCNCGAPTTYTKAFRAFTPLLRLGPLLNIEGAEHVWLPIPMCQACQGDTSRQYRKAFARTFLMVLAIGAGGGFLLGTLITLLSGNAKLFPLLPVFLSLSAGLVSLFFAWFLGKKAAAKVVAPVQLQRYLPEKGTVDVRFRRCEYAERILREVR